jgi:hypothetical protein
MPDTDSATYNWPRADSQRTRRRPAQRVGAFTSAVLLLFALCVTIATRAAADDNIIVNPNLTTGKGAAPEGWTSEGWIATPDTTTYNWAHPPGGGQLEITSAKGNDARWIQNLHLGSGWYYFSADIRSENVADNNTGASIGLMEDGIISQQLHGTRDWTKVGFYLKAGDQGADIVLDCRLGGFASLNTGKMACRSFKGVKVKEPPDNDTPRYDLDVVRNGGTPPPAAGGGANVALPLALAVLVLAALFYWRRFGKNWARKAWTSLQRMPPGGSAAPLPPDATRQRIEITLFCVTLLTFAYFYQAADHSTGSRFDLVRSILERGSLWIDGYCGYNTADIVELHSHIYSNKAPGCAFTGLVPWLFVTTVMRIFLNQNDWFWALATHLGTVFSVGLLSSVLIVLIYRFVLRLGAGNARAVALALILAFGTILFPYATEFTGEPIAALCVFASFYLLAFLDPGDNTYRNLFAGLLAGWSVVCDYPTFVLAAGVGVYALWKLRDWRKIAPFAIGAAACAMVLASYNLFAFGSPFFLSYEAYMGAANAGRFPEQSVGFAGVTYPRIAVLWDVLFSAERGLYVCNPVLLLAFPGLYYFWRRSSYRGELLLIAYVIVSFILFNGSYGESIIYWGGGTATGPRHILSAVPFMVLAMAFLPKRLDPVLGFLALASVFVMLMATAIEPHLPYEYDNPLVDFLWPAYLRGDLAYNKGAYYGGGPIAGDSVAFNLGKLAGLPGALQLWPLAMVWLGGAWELMRNLDLWNHPALRRRMAAIATIAILALISPPVFGALFLRPKLDQSHGLLGRYYEGLRNSGFPPHIERVDQQVDFDSIVALGSLPYPSYATWTGKLIAPVTGTYQFSIMVDDSGWLKIDGRDVIADPGDVTKQSDSGEVYLTAGTHKIEAGERNIWGGSMMRLIWNPPGGQQEVVPSKYLIPEPVDQTHRSGRDLIQKAQG